MTEHQAITRLFISIITGIFVVSLVLYSCSFAARHSLFQDSQSISKSVQKGTSPLRSVKNTKKWRYADKINRSFSPRQAEKGDAIVMELFQGETYSCRVQHISTDMNGVVSLTGNIEGYSFGSFVMSAKGEEILVTVNIPEKDTSYKIIRRKNDGRYILAEIDTAVKDGDWGNEGNDVIMENDEVFPYVGTGKPPGRINAEKSTVYGDETSINVAVFYTPQVAAIVDGDIDLFLADIFADSNLVLSNSNTGARLNLVGSMQISAESGEDYTKLPMWSLATNEALPDHYTFRKEHKSDLDILLFHREGSVGGGTGARVNAYMATAPNYTFMHEIGHCLSAGHHYATGDGIRDGYNKKNGKYSSGWRGYVPQAGKAFSTVMTYPSEIGYNDDGSIAWNYADGYGYSTRIPYFSSPMTDYYGVNLGIASPEADADPPGMDNSRVIRETKGSISNYRSSNGSIRVVIEPKEAVDAGAKWYLNRFASNRESGHRGVRLPSSTTTPYRITFYNVSGWTKPSDMSFFITDNQEVNIVARYLRSGETTGTSLKVVLTPEAAVNAGAMWRIAGTGLWRPSGSVEESIGNGTYQIEYSDTEGGKFMTPPIQEITISSGLMTIEVVGSYKNADLPGSLKVNLIADARMQEQPKWRRAGTATWHASGHTESGLLPGLYEIEFSDHEGFKVFDQASVFVVGGVTLERTYRFKGYGYITGILAPQTAVENGALWKVIGETTWHNSTEKALLAEGEYTIQYSDIDMHYKPANVFFTIEAASHNSIEAIYTQQGNIQIFIIPDAAVTDGAKWRLYGQTNIWRDSGAIVKTLVGSPEIAFSDVARYYKPIGWQKVNVNYNNTTVATFEYAGIGYLKVDIEPSEARAAGAKWRPVGTTSWKNSGETIEIAEGNKTVEFLDISSYGFASPEILTVNIQKGFTAEATGNYLVSNSSGYIKVNIQPQSAVEKGAMWKIKGQTIWHTSEETAPLPQGEYTIQYSNIELHSKPANALITIEANKKSLIDATYTQRGFMQIFIIPEAAVTDGAKWRLYGQTDIWRDTGSILENIIGTSEITFSDVLGYYKPAGWQKIDVNYNNTTVATFEYAGIGYLKVDIEPSEARAAGAKWRPVGTTSWKNSGETIEIAEGNKTVEFLDISSYGFASPEILTVNIQKGFTAEATGNYLVSNSSGYIKVNIQPQSAVEKGAMWKISGQTIWHSSEETVLLLEGKYTIEYSDVEMHSKPANASITIEANILNTIEAQYIQKGRLKVMIEPESAVSSGAKWRKYGQSNTWRNNGEEMILDVGSGITYQVMFSSEVTDHIYPRGEGWPGWPGWHAFTISYDQTTEVRGVYRQSGTLRVNISPEDAVINGAKWRLKGDTAWKSSGEAVAVPAGITTVEFKTAGGYFLHDDIELPILYAEERTFNAAYRKLTANLIVVITPESAVSAGAAWRLEGEDAWYGAGSQRELEIGSYVLEFKDLYAFDAPEKMNVVISEPGKDGPPLIIVGQYSHRYGAIKVLIEPKDAVDIGAMWRTSGASVWNQSGDEVSLPVGDHEIEFSGLEYQGFYTRPLNATAKVLRDKTTVITGVYVAGNDSWLRVDMDYHGKIPSEEGMWKISGSQEVWYPSGHPVLLFPGFYTVEFKEIHGYTAPAKTTVALVGGDSTIIRRTYIEGDGLGLLSIDILYNGMSTNEGRWKYAADGEWLCSGDLVSLEPGQYSILFKDIEGYSKPQTMSLSVSKGYKTLRRAYYVEGVGKGFLTVGVEYEGGKPIEGGGWKILGETEWRDPGQGISLDPGSYIIEFRPVHGAYKPKNAFRQVISGRNTSVVGVYIPLTSLGEALDNSDLSWTTSVNSSWVGLKDTLWAYHGGNTARSGEVGDNEESWIETSVTGPGQISFWWKVNSAINRDYLEVYINGELKDRISGDFGWQKKHYLIDPDTHIIRWRYYKGHGEPSGADCGFLDKVELVQFKGNLTVTIGPQNALIQEAKWRRKGTSVWLRSGDKEAGLLAGVYIIEFLEIPGFVKPSDIEVVINNNDDMLLRAEYDIDSSHISVLISPEDAVNAGAMWRFKGEGDDKWRQPTIEAVAPAEVYEIEFKHIEYWDKPSDAVIETSLNHVSLISGSYVRHCGSLSMPIVFPLQFSNSIEWRIATEDAWRKLGVTREGVAVGSHRIEFAGLPEGWRLERIIFTNDMENEAALSQGTEPLLVVERAKQTFFAPVFIKPNSGSLTVWIRPSSARKEGKWRIKEHGGEWKDHGHREIGIPVGSYTIEYKSIDGWESPEDYIVEINDQAGRVIGLLTGPSYKTSFGILRVVIEPQEAVEAGAKWRRTGTSYWRDSGTYEQKIPVGTFEVEFLQGWDEGSVEGWAAPTNIEVEIQEGEITEITAAYDKRISALRMNVLDAPAGGLKVIIEPAEAAGSGAKWRRAGTTVWFDSGAEETGLTAGNYEVEFRDVSGWHKPLNRTAEVKSGNTAEESGTYQRMIYGRVLPYPNPYDPVKDGAVKLTYTLETDADVNIYVFDTSRRLVYMYSCMSGAIGGKQGYNEIEWRGVDMFGRVVDNGACLIRMVENGTGRLLGKGKILIYKRR